jgi:hypothetical protein
MKRLALLIALALSSSLAVAKLPALSDDAKAKAAEAAAKTAHGNKVADFQLCKSMNRTASVYYADAKKAGKDVKPPTPTPDCVDPGPFAAPGAAPAPAAAPAVAPAAPPAAAGKPAPKKT